MDISSMNNSVTNINNIRFSDTWSGSASDAQVESLNGFMIDLNKCIDDVSAFDAILVLKDDYVKICNEISRLNGLIASCSVDHSDPESSCSCGYYASQIQQLEVQRMQLRNTIIGLLGQFSGINPEIAPPADLTTFDETNPDDLETLGTFNGEFPLFDQTDYNTIFVGNKTIATSGCALTCAAMVISAYTGQTITPSMLMEQYPYVYNNQTTMNNMMAQYGIRNANSNALNEEKGMTLNLTSHDMYIDGGFTEIDSDTMGFDLMYDKLKDGYACAIYMGPGDFTGGGHYVLATGINDDGTININDPYGPNYNKGVLKDGFENGFDPAFIRRNARGGYLIEPYEDYIARQQQN